MDKSLAGDLRSELREAAEPVADTSAEFALGRIRNMPGSPRWAGMRTVAGARSVIVVPSARRRRGGKGRPNLAKLLLERAMDPALEAKSDEVVKRVDRMLGRLAGHNGF